MKAMTKITALAISCLLMGGAMFAEDKPAAKPAEAPKAAKDDKAVEKKPAAKQTKTIRTTKSKDGY